VDTGRELLQAEGRVAPLGTRDASLPTDVAGATGVANGRRATATPLPLLVAEAGRDARVGREPAPRETLASSVQLKVEAETLGAETLGVETLGVETTDASPLPNSVQASAAQQDVDAHQHTADDLRMAGAWREWLGALARDPEAALAAAQAYQQLDAAGRDEWLKAVDSDLAGLGVPAVAVYSPLLAVESDPQRTATMRQRIARGRAVEPPPSVPRRALLGRLANGVRLGVLVEPLYLQFVQVLACAYVPAQRFTWVRHDPIALDEQAPNSGHLLEGAVLETVPVRLLVDELARTVVSHRRLGGTLPDALCLFANLFGLEHMVGGGDELTLR
jgi:hypothetical protein